MIVWLTQDRLPGATRGAIGQRNNCCRTFHDPVAKPATDAIPEKFSGMTSDSAFGWAGCHELRSHCGTLAYQPPAVTRFNRTRIHCASVRDVSRSPTVTGPHKSEPFRGR